MIEIFISILTTFITGELKILQHICPFNEKLPWEAVWDCKILFYDEEEQEEEDDEMIESGHQTDTNNVDKQNRSSAKSTTEAKPYSKESIKMAQSNKENSSPSNAVAEDQTSSLKDPIPRKGIGCKCSVM